MGLRHLAPRHPARLGGVAGHERRRRAPDLPENPREALARALRALGHAGPGVAGVGVRQRDDEQLEREALSGHHGLEVAVVDLRGPRRPLELEIALFGALAVRVSPLAHVGVALWSRSPCSPSPRPAGHRCASRYGAACEVRPNRPRERHRSMRRRRVRVRGAPSTSAPAPRATCRPYRRIWRRCCGSASASSRSPHAGPPRRPSRVYH